MSDCIGTGCKSEAMEQQIAKWKQRALFAEDELKRIQRLPELDWALACAEIVREFAATSRAGDTEAAKRMLEALDKCKTYVNRVETQRNDAQGELKHLKQVFVDWTNSFDKLRDELGKLRNAAKPSYGNGAYGQQMGNEMYSIKVTGNTLGDIDELLRLHNYGEGNGTKD